MTVDMEQPLRQSPGGIASSPMHLFNLALFLLVFLLRQPFGLMVSAIVGFRQRCFNGMAFVVIEMLKDAWGVYLGTLTNSDFWQNILHNCQKALIGPIP